MTQTQPAQQQQSYRWVILVAMCVIGFMTIGTRSTVSSFLKTIVADLGTNRETISFVIAANIWLVDSCSLSPAILWIALVPVACLPPA